MERRQFERKPLGGGPGVLVSLCLNSHSLVHAGRSEAIELEARATDISQGGLGLKLRVLADLIILYPDHNVTVRLGTGKKAKLLPARVAHFNRDQGKMGLEFAKPLRSLKL